MRIVFQDVARPKAAAKQLTRLSPAVKLTGAQAAVSHATGYRDWHELAGQTATGAAAAAAPTPEQVNQVVLKVADELRLPDGDVQFALSRARLFRAENACIEVQLKVRTMTIRARSFGAPARGKPGTVVKVNAHGEVRHAYLCRTGRPSHVLYDTGFGICADFELVTPRIPLEDFLPARLWLPYGFWTLRDGSKVTFSRDYFPMWRVSGGCVERLDPWLWIKDIVNHQHFTTTCGTVAWSHGPARNLALAHLAENRIFELPRLADAMPHLIEPDVETLSEGVRRLRHCLGTGAPLPHYARLNDRLA